MNNPTEAGLSCHTNWEFPDWIIGIQQEFLTALSYCGHDNVPPKAFLDKVKRMAESVGLRMKVEVKSKLNCGLIVQSYNNQDADVYQICFEDLNG